MTELSPVGYALSRERARANEDEFFDTLDAYAADPEFDVVEAAIAAAEHTGLPWRWQASIGHLDVCVDPVAGWQRKLRCRWWQVGRKRFAAIGSTYYTITHHYPREQRLGRPMAHGYTWR